MPIDRPLFLPRAALEALRGQRGFEATAVGLWSVGDPAGLARPCVAVVGTRAATSYGRRVAREFAAELGRAGCCVVSGLALGIDAAAHEGALEAGAPTVGVLGCGHDRFFPERNRPLAERIVAAGGAVLSPFEPERAALPHQFLQRNGIVAALSDAVVVIEAPARSGALNTASWAAGRVPVLAVPGDVDRRHVAGCHALIRDGATLARNAADVLEAIGLNKPLPLPFDDPVFDEDPLARTLLGALEAGPAAIDDLVVQAGADAAAVMAALTLLELRDAIAIDGAIVRK
ncbi:MAG TPA: DNA-processing protein DprA [Candidatus Baltobacteraceae bacterium]|jgi:DNA processing protein